MHEVDQLIKTCVKDFLNPLPKTKKRKRETLTEVIKKKKY